MSHGSQQDQFLLGSYSMSSWSNSGSAMLALKPKSQDNKLSIGLLKASNTTGGVCLYACMLVEILLCQLPESCMSVHPAASRTLSVCASVSFHDLVCLAACQLANPLSVSAVFSFDNSVCQSTLS